MTNASITIIDLGAERARRNQPVGYSFVAPGDEVPPPVSDTTSTVEAIAADAIQAAVLRAYAAGLPAPGPALALAAMRAAAGLLAHITSDDPKLIGREAQHAAEAASRWAVMVWPPAR